MAASAPAPIKSQPRSRFMAMLSIPWVDKTIAIVAVTPSVIELYRRYTSATLNFPRAVLGLHVFILIITMVIRRTPVSVTPNPWFWLLAFVATYGVMAFTVAARTREIGIRMALGAGQARVLRLVMGESVALTAIGIALGVPGAMLASHAVGSFLYGLSATDPWTYALLAAVLAGIALSAAWIPARRAARVDPMVALRYE